MTIAELELFYTKMRRDVITLTEEFNKREDIKPGRTYTFELVRSTKDEGESTQTREDLVIFNDKLLGIIHELSDELREVKSRLEKSGPKE